MDVWNGMYFDSISLFASGLSLRPLNGERGGSGGLARLIRDHWPLASVALGMLDEPETGASDVSGSEYGKPRSQSD